MIEEMLEYNRKSLEAGAFEKYKTDKYPDKKLAVVSCMDTRLTELLPAALGCRNGDMNLIANAGGVVTEEYDMVMKSLLIAIYDLHVEQILVIGHTDCGAAKAEAASLVNKMISRGIPPACIAEIQAQGIPLMSWLEGFGDTDASVRESVSRIRKHPLIPKEMEVYGLILDTDSGRLREVLPPEE